MVLPCKSSKQMNIPLYIENVVVYIKGERENKSKLLLNISNN